MQGAFKPELHISASANAENQSRFFNYANTKPIQLTPYGGKHPTAYAERLSLNVKEQHDLKAKKCPNQVVVKSSDYKFITDSRYGIVEGIIHSCAFILHASLHSRYVIGHLNSEVGIRENVFQEVFPRIFKELTKGRLNSYKAILIGGNEDFFQRLKEYLENKGIQISASYCDNYAEANIYDTLGNKSFIYDPQNYTVSLFSPEFPEGLLSLTSGMHQTLQQDFTSQHQLLVRISQAMVDDNQSSSTEEPPPSPLR